MAFLPCQGNFGIANERPRKGIAYVWPKVQGLKQSLVWAEKESNWWYRRPDGQSAICYQMRCHHNFVWVFNNTKRFIVMSVFSKHYRKWFMTADTPHWDPKAKSSNYRVSVRQVQYDTTLCRYSYVQVSPECLNSEIFQLIPLENITSILVY